MFLFTSRAPGEAQAAQPSTPFAEPLRRAAQATGVSFDYLARTAERESRFDPKARAGTSSATGMFQFLDQTWLGMIKQEGPRFGLAQEAQAIAGEGGRLNVGDPALRQRIMALREDPQVSAMMAGAFAARNGQQLEQALGRRPNEGELYMAHFLGAQGARDLIQLAQARPDAPAAASFRDAAAANRSVFFDRNGRVRSAREVYDGLAATFTQPRGPEAVQTAATRDTAHDMFRVKGEGKPLHGLFRSSGEPVASAVADAWARMGRRAPVAQPDQTRVAFFPREGTGQKVVSDAMPTIAAAEQGRGRMSVQLPPERPGSAQRPDTASVQPPGRLRTAGKPLDLLQFLSPGLRK